MIRETGFYLNQPASAAQIMGFADSFGGRLDRMTITDAALKSKSGKPDEGRIAQALAAKYPPTQILLFQKGEGGNNHFPQCGLMLTRLSQAEDPQGIFSVVAHIPADKARIAADWWALAARHGWNAGNGYLMRWPIRDINYGMFAASVPDRQTGTWTDFAAACDRLDLDPASFQPVIAGKMLRNVLRHNFLTQALAATIADCLKRADLAPGDMLHVAPGRVVWSLPDTGAQRLAHAALHAQGLVWEPVWLDLEGDQPMPPAA